MDTDGDSGEGNTVCGEIVDLRLSDGGCFLMADCRFQDVRLQMFLMSDCRLLL